MQLCGHGIFLTHCLQHESVRIGLYPDTHIAASLYVNKTQKLEGPQLLSLTLIPHWWEVCHLKHVMHISRAAWNPTCLLVLGQSGLFLLFNVLITWHISLTILGKLADLPPNACNSLGVWSIDVLRDFVTCLEAKPCELQLVPSIIMQLQTCMS